MNKHRLRQLRIKRIDLVDQGAAVDAKVTLFKRRDDVAKEGPKTMTLAEALAAMPEETRKVVEAALAEAAGSSKPQEVEKQPMEEKKPEAPAAPFAPVAEAKPGAEDPKKDELEKRLADERATLEKRHAEELETIRKQATEARAEIEKMRDAELDRECVAKAATFPAGMVGLSQEEGAKILKSLRRKEALPEDLADKLVKHFAATQEVVAKSGLLKEIGTSAGGDAAGPKEKLESVAKSKREKDPQLTPEQAFLEACNDYPSDYAELRKQG